MVRQVTGDGIDWYQYGKVILLKKLISFIKKYAKDWPNTTIQEDGASSHTHPVQREIYDIFKVQRLLWPGNSPDLNMIEPAWAYLKRVTTKKGPLKTRKETIKAWTKAWEELEQSRIQAWIERIVDHLEEIRKLEGRNHYCEGRRRV